MTSDTSTEDRIRARAYGLWESEGRTDGHHERHWHEASREIGESGGDENAGLSAGDGNAPADAAASQAEIPESDSGKAGGSRKKAANDSTYGPA